MFDSKYENMMKSLLTESKKLTEDNFKIPAKAKSAVNELREQFTGLIDSLNSRNFEYSGSSLDYAVDTLIFDCYSEEFYDKLRKLGINDDVIDKIWNIVYDKFEPAITEAESNYENEGYEDDDDYEYDDEEEYEDLDESKRSNIKSKKLTEDVNEELNVTTSEEPVEDDEDMEGEAEGVVVVVDPDLTSDDYEKAIKQAEDTIDETPEGEQPTDEQYIGQNIYTCPVCGNTFFSEVELDEGDACPVCSEVPESFVLNGKVEGDITEEDEELVDELGDNMEEGEEVPVEETETTEEITEGPVEEPVDEEEEEVKGESLKTEVKKGTNIKTEATIRRYRVSFYVDTTDMNNMDIEEAVDAMLSNSQLRSDNDTIDVELVNELGESKKVGRKATVMGFDASELNSINENYRNVAKKYWFDYRGEPICLKEEAKVLDEKANPENAEANKKIRDVLLNGPSSRYYQDVLDMGYEVALDKYDDHNYVVSNPNKPAYQSNFATRSSDLSAFSGDERAMRSDRIRKMKASKNKQIDYKNYLDKDYSPRSTGRRIQYGSGKNPGEHSDSAYIKGNIHDIPTYDEYNQDTFNTDYSNAGSPNMREFRNAKAKMRAYEDPNYNSYRDTNYKHQDTYNVGSKDGLDKSVSRAEQDLADFEAGLEAQRQKYKDNIAKAKQKRDAGAANYQANKDTVDRLLKRKQN